MIVPATTATQVGSCTRLPVVLAGTELVKLSIAEMVKGQCEEVVLEAEVTNTGALALYQNLGFIRDKRLHRYLPVDLPELHPFLHCFGSA